MKSPEQIKWEKKELDKFPPHRHAGKALSETGYLKTCSACRRLFRLDKRWESLAKIRGEK